MIYCDTSVLVAALTPEEQTETAHTWLGAQGTGQLCVSGWTATELSCALSRKVRSGNLMIEHRARILTVWRSMLGTRLEVVPVKAEAFETAVTLTDRHDLSIRAGDALHLAIASLGGHSVATLDISMADAAIFIGVSVAQIG